MAVVLTDFAADPGLAFLVVILGGAFQVLFGMLRIGRYIELVPYSVLSGFMTGIGCIIILLELAPLIGQPNPAGGVLAAVANLPRAFADIGRDAAILGVLSLVIVFATPKRIGRYVPSPLIALVVGTLLAVFVLGGAPAIGDIPTGIPAPKLPSFSLDALPAVVRGALILAALGSIDSLLTSLVHDNMTRTYHRPNRELIGQGIGNMIAGLFGGLPGAGATMRTVVNLRAGGRTPVSGAIHALILLALVLGLAPLASFIPHAVLAGILVKVGIDIVDWGFLRRLHRAPRAAALKMLVVLALTVFVDLILAVGVGIVMASLIYVKYMADLQIEQLRVVRDAASGARLSELEADALEQTAGRVVLLQPQGPLSFGSATALGRRLDEAGPFEALVIDLSDVPTIDGSAAVALEQIVDRALAADRPTFVCGLQEKPRATLERLGILDRLHPSHHTADRLAAIEEAARSLVDARRIREG